MDSCILMFFVFQLILNAVFLWLFYSLIQGEEIKAVEKHLSNGIKSVFEYCKDYRMDVIDYRDEMTKRIEKIEKTIGNKNERK